MTKQIKPSEVFVPGKFPIEEHNIYTDRGAPQESFQTALKRSFVPLVFGSYGVGKSSLSRYCTKGAEKNKKLVYIESVHGKSLADILTRLLEILGYEVTVERQIQTICESGAETGFELQGGILGYLKAKIGGKLSRKRKKLLGTKREVLVKSPTDSRILDLCEDAGLMLLIDEMHRASDILRRDLSAFLKAYANRNHKKFKIGIIGTETDASKIVIRDPGVDRLLQEVHVLPITESESRRIVFEGMKRLDIKVPEEIGIRIIRASVGSPFVAQYICLEMAEKCRERGLDTLTSELLNEALRTYASSKAQRMIHQYRLAIETTGEKRYRQKILHAMALCDDDYVTMEQLVALVSKQMGEVVPSTALSGPLRQLKNEEYGLILTDVSGPSAGSRAFNYSAFTDPAMKSIIRMIEEFGTPDIGSENGGKASSS